MQIIVQIQEFLFTECLPLGDSGNGKNFASNSINNDYNDSER